MPMPRLPATHHNTTATIRAFHVKKNSAAMAPMWNAAMKAAVKLNCWVNVLSLEKRCISTVVLIAAPIEICAAITFDGHAHVAGARIL